jgi:hypothetical protein
MRWCRHAKAAPVTAELALALSRRAIRRLDAVAVSLMLVFAGFVAPEERWRASTCSRLAGLRLVSVSAHK